MHLLAHVGLVDAALGRKEEALREGRRAVELLPTAEDSMFGEYTTEGFIKTRFAMICVWAGERELALEQLEALTKIAGGAKLMAALRLDSMWDPLRGDRASKKSSLP